jgi:hypothetical protein
MDASAARRRPLGRFDPERTARTHWDEETMDAAALHRYFDIRDRTPVTGAAPGSGQPAGRNAGSGHETSDLAGAR